MSRGPSLIQLFIGIALIGAVPGSFFAGMQYQASKDAAKATPPTPSIDLPPWVSWGSRVEPNEAGFILYGVGSASGIRNASLARSTADNRARAELAKLFEVQLEAAAKKLGDTSDATAQEVLKTGSSHALNGVEIVDHWIHPQTGEIYSLARLDSAVLADIIQRETQEPQRSKLNDAVQGAMKDAVR